MIPDCAYGSSLYFMDSYLYSMDMSPSVLEHVLIFFVQDIQSLVLLHAYNQLLLQRALIPFTEDGVWKSDLCAQCAHRYWGSLLLGFLGG